MELMKMTKNYKQLAGLVIFTISWVYWSSNYSLKHTTFSLAPYFNKMHANFTNEILIKPSEGTCQGPLFLIMLVTSYVGQVELRSAHRRALPPDLLKSMKIARVFLLARIPEDEKYAQDVNQTSIEDENNTYGDILQGSFMENYKHLPYKNIMGMHWASTVCHRATFVLKVDDDTVFNIEQTYELLLHENLENTMLGFYVTDNYPARGRRHKHYVNWYEYPRTDYPLYLYGCYYITTPKVAGYLYEATVHLRYSMLWLEDVMISGLLSELINNQTSVNIKLRQLPWDLILYYSLFECCINEMIEKRWVCDSVGWNGGNYNLIYEYYEALRSCRNCTKRPTDKPLMESCASSRQVFIKKQQFFYVFLLLLCCFGLCLIYFYRPFSKLSVCYTLHNGDLFSRKYVH